MQNNIDKAKRAGAIISAIMIVIPIALVILGILFLIYGSEDFFINGIMLIYIIGGGAVIVGVLAALKQRLKEIESGEEEEAKKY